MSGLTSDISSLERVFAAAELKPAAVQRDYQWRREQCAALFADFERAWREAMVASAAQTPAAQESVTPDSSVETDGASAFVPTLPEADARASGAYFLGAIVLRPVEDDLFQVFDGLQRLTTLTILLAVLRDLLDGTDHDERLEALIHTSNGQPRMRLGGADQTLANLIQRRSEAVRSRRNLSANTLRGRLLEAAGLFHSHLKSWSQADIASYADFVLKNVHVSLILVADERLARQIFITTNNRGVSLDEADVLKSQINSIPFREDVAHHVLGAWRSVSGAFEDREDYVDFLYAVDFLTRRRGRSSEGLTELGEYLASVLDDEGIVEWVADYNAYARGWAWLLKVRDNPREADPFDGEIFRLFAFDWEEWKPAALVFSLAVAKARDAKDKRRLKTLRSRFADLNRFCAAVTLAEWSPAQRTEAFARALGEIKRGRNPFSGALALPDDEWDKVRDALSSPLGDISAATQILRWLAAGGRPTARSAQLRGARIEHVMPAKSDEGSQWSAVGADPADAWRLAHRLGNFIVKSGDEATNAADGFASWKKAVKGASGAYWLADDVAKFRRWDAAEIDKRTAQLQRDILKALNAPKASPATPIRSVSGARRSGVRAA